MIYIDFMQMPEWLVIESDPLEDDVSRICPFYEYSNDSWSIYLLS